MKFKYFTLNDSKREAVGVVNASTLEKAYKIASGIKKLSLERFKKLFGVEKL